MATLRATAEAQPNQKREEEEDEEEEAEDIDWGETLGLLAFFQIALPEKCLVFR